MSELESLKRQIVRQTVAENVALIEGTRLAQARERRARQRRNWLRTSLVVAVGLGGAFLADVYDLSSELLPRLRDAADHGAEFRPASAGAADTGARAPEAERRSRWSTEPTVVPEDAPERIDPSIFPLEVRHVVLDPGHGGEDLGTRNSTLREKDLTLDIALRVRELLHKEGFEVSLTRETDREVVLRERRDFANRARADVFVSIHINWIVNRSVRGVETYYLGPTKDPELTELARRENEQSGYTMFEQSQLIEKVYRHAQHERSQLLAGRIQSSLFRSLRDVNPALRNRGVKTAPFVVLIGTEMPAILAEVSCLSNDREVELLKKPLYKNHIAQALFKGLLGYAGEVNPSTVVRLGT